MDAHKNEIKSETNLWTRNSAVVPLCSRENQKKKTLPPSRGAVGEEGYSQTLIYVWLGLIRRKFMFDYKVSDINLRDTWNQTQKVIFTSDPRLPGVSSWLLIYKFTTDHFLCLIFVRQM